ncbi:hypothetical protein ACFE04_017358 [Oxalis oulophora]
MMRCKKHPYDVSSCVGVCSTCLRERLLILIAAQEQAEAQLASTGLLLHAPSPAPMIFPRSVSPYVSRRKSDDTTSATWQHHHHHNNNNRGQFDQRFFSTPQVGPTYDATTGAPSNLTASRSCRRKSSSWKSSVWSNLFVKSRSRQPTSDFNNNNNNSSRDSCAGDNRPSSSSSEFNNSPSWFSSLFPHRRRKKQSRLFSMADSGCRRPIRASDRGMSPERGEEDDYDPFPSECDWRSTPAATPWSARRSRQCQVKNMSSLAFCLSPLVRPSPSRLWSTKSGSLVSDMGLSGEIRGGGGGLVKPHLASAASFCSNRSRKLVDIGKVNHNR